MQLKTIDLCAGIGGIRRGFELAGDYTNVESAEIDEFACRTYQHLYGDNPRHNVSDQEFKKNLQSLRYDVLLAGFPCQAFSSVGQRKGFEDKTKGTIFFDIADIIKMTRPKVVFLENVQNLLSHDKKATINTIFDTLERQLDYHIVGLKHDAKGNMVIERSSFLRNSIDFGIPQNRPRVYIIAFSRAYFGKHVDLIDKELPTKRIGTAIYDDLSSILEDDVEPRYFLSAKYLETLERHIIVQHEKGYGFGYRIVNSPEIKKPTANTLLATGGSGKERNLILDYKNGNKYAGRELKGKSSPINDKCIRTMTPTEWGRLQGFIGYGFIGDNGEEKFSFPEGIPVGQQFKQFGNSVTIPVIEEMAKFILRNIDTVYSSFSSIERRLFSMYDNEFLLCRRIWEGLGTTLREKTLNQYFDAVYYFGSRPFRTKELAEYLKVSSARASQILVQLSGMNCVIKIDERSYAFEDLLSKTND
jgi:DNA (cytosine-5-)-methyltransferase